MTQPDDENQTVWTAITDWSWYTYEGRQYPDIGVHFVAFEALPPLSTDDGAEGLPSDSPVDRSGE